MLALWRGAAPTPCDYSSHRVTGESFAIDGGGLTGGLAPAGYSPVAGAEVARA